MSPLGARMDILVNAVDEVVALGAIGCRRETKAHKFTAKVGILERCLVPPVDLNADRVVKG